MRPIVAFIACILFVWCCKINPHIEWPWFDKNGTHIVYEDDNEKTTIHHKGEFVINDEETAFESMSPDAYVSYSKGNVDFEAKSDSKGVITYFINGEKLTFSNAEKTMLNEILVNLSNIGIDAQGKCVKLYNKGGIPAILDRVDNLKNDMVKSVYFGYVLDKSISDTEAALIMNKIQDMESDFDKSNLLQKVKASNLQTVDCVNAYIAATKSIESDFDKAIDIKYLIKNANATLLNSNLNEVITAIDSDFDKKNVLDVLLDNKKVVPENLSFVPSIMETLDSDFEQAEILKKYYSVFGTNTAQIIATINVVKDIESDFEAAAVMKALAEKKPKFNDLEFVEYLSAVKSIESNFEKSSVLEAYISLAKSDAQWVNLIGLAEDLESAFEKENLLVAIGNKMSKSPSVIEAFKHAAESMDNDASYGKLVRMTNIN
jgi:hypothetical protein